MLFVVAEVESAAFETSNFAALSRLGRGRAGNPLHAVHFATDGGAHGVTRPTCSVPGNSYPNSCGLVKFVSRFEIRWYWMALKYFRTIAVNPQGCDGGVRN
jgi:hypothetical protein